MKRMKGKSPVKNLKFLEDEQYLEEVTGETEVNN